WQWHARASVAQRQGREYDYVRSPLRRSGEVQAEAVRRRSRDNLSVAKDGAELKEVARTEVTLRNPVLVGLVVCAHNADKSETVVFSDVSVESTVPPGSH